MVWGHGSSEDQGSWMGGLGWVGKKRLKERQQWLGFVGVLGQTMGLV
jgi:hypothetical protein